MRRYARFSPWIKHSPECYLMVGDISPGTKAMTSSAGQGTLDNGGSQGVREFNSGSHI